MDGSRFDEVTRIPLGYARIKYFCGKLNVNLSSIDQLIKILTDLVVLK